MSKKYIKPMARNVAKVQISSGSCLSGSGETQMGNCSVSGANALFNCGGGGNVLPFSGCTDGGAAGGGCVNGTNAG